MFNNNFNQNSSFPQMRISGRCPVCHAVYDFEKLQILGEKNHSLLVYMECSVCGASVISFLSLNPRGMFAEAVVTDLSPEEVIELNLSSPVSIDDVLFVHRFLNQDKKAVSNLLKE